MTKMMGVSTSELWGYSSSDFSGEIQISVFFINKNKKSVLSVCLKRPAVAPSTLLLEPLAGKTFAEVFHSVCSDAGFRELRFGIKVGSELLVIRERQR